MSKELKMGWKFMKSLAVIMLMLTCSCGRVKAEIHKHEAQDLAEQINKDYNYRTLR